jgi:predicted RNA methylase
MRQPIVITTPYPTPEELAKNYGVSKKRLKELGAMVDEFLSKSSVSRAKKAKKKHASSKAATSQKKKQVRVEAGSAFLNLPYDAKFHRRSVAHVARVASFGFATKGSA